MRLPSTAAREGGYGTGRVGLLAALGAAAVVALGGCGETGAGEASSGQEARVPAGQEARTPAGSASAADTPVGRQRPTTTLRVGGVRVRAEVADREAERRRGLMGRDSLPEDHGMLFVYPEQRILSFWMRNTRIPLDIAFIDQRGTIVDVQTMAPHTEEMHRSREPAMYALEMEAGWFEEHGVGVGDRVEF